MKGISSQKLIDLYRVIMKIRRLGEKIAELYYPEQQMRCPVHLSIGQEAIAVGVCANLYKTDYVFGSHRGHALYIAKGGSLNAFMAELYGKKAGCTKGRGGSQHMAAPEVGLLGCSAVVGGTIPVAVGVALASVMQKNRKVTVAIFGDGATEEGVFHESLNFASLKKLPIVFICENNFYSVQSHILLRQPSINIYRKAKGYGMPGLCVDGNDVIAVFRASRKAIRRARQGKGPTLIECRTYRWREHVGPDWDFDLGYRSKEEVNAWMKKCPLKRYEEFLIKYRIIPQSKIIHITRQIDSEIDRAVMFAKKSPFPDEIKNFWDSYKT